VLRIVIVHFKQQKSLITLLLQTTLYADYFSMKFKNFFLKFLRRPRNIRMNYKGKANGESGSLAYGNKKD